MHRLEIAATLLTPFILFCLGVLFYSWQTRQNEIIKFKIGLLIEVFNLTGQLRDMCVTMSYPLSFGPHPADGILEVIPAVQNNLQAKVNQMMLIDKNLFNYCEKILGSSRKLATSYIAYKGYLDKSDDTSRELRSDFHKKWTEQYPKEIEETYASICDGVGLYLKETNPISSLKMYFRKD